MEETNCIITFNLSLFFKRDVKHSSERINYTLHYLYLNSGLGKFGHLEGTPCLYRILQKQPHSAIRNKCNPVVPLRLIIVCALQNNGGKVFGGYGDKLATKTSIVQRKLDLVYLGSKIRNFPVLALQEKRFLLQGLV